MRSPLSDARYIDGLCWDGGKHAADLIQQGRGGAHGDESGGGRSAPRPTVGSLQIPDRPCDRRMAEQIALEVFGKQGRTRVSPFGWLATGLFVSSRSPQRLTMYSQRWSLSQMDTGTQAISPLRSISLFNSHAGSGRGPQNA